MTAGTGIPRLGGQPAVPVDLEAVRQRYDLYRDHQLAAWARQWSCCSAHGPADDIPKLLAEVERLRHLVEAESREKFRQGVELRADVDALLPPARLYLAALDTDPDNEYLTLPEAMLVTAVRGVVAKHGGEVR